MNLRACLLFVLSLPLLPAWSRETIPFDDGWQFARFGAMPDGGTLEEPDGIEQLEYDDSDWRTLDLPHDWGIEGPFRADLPNQTGKLPWAGIGWYRKAFFSPQSDADRRVFIDFDGSMSGTKVWLNGQYVGQWPYGYSSFRLELTDFLKAGEENLIAVRLDNPPNSSRWYPGGGIYRHVRIVKTAPTHVAHWGVFVTTPSVTAQSATVNIATQVEGDASGIELSHQIVLDDEPSMVVGEQTVKGVRACTMRIDSPRLWSLDSPHLYRVDTSIRKNGEIVDDYQTVFGIRSIQYDADEGFRLNGKLVRMNGACQHHDLGPLGSAVNRRAIERQLEILRSMGCNAIRTSHNPPTPELLEICDRMGMLVQVEAFDCWKTGKVDNDYSRFFSEWHERDLSAMVRRDRNHPSVVMWSTGNEIREQGKVEGHKISRRLTAIVKQHDLTRPVSAGCNNQQAGFNGFQTTIDLFGYNYKPHRYAAFRAANPSQPLYGSETASTVSTRGEYFFPVSDDKSKGAGGRFQVSSYDLSAPPWAYRPDIEFEAQDKHPEVFGEFVWTGFDYLGEPTPYNKDQTNLLNFTDPEDRRRMKEQLAKLGGNIPPRSSYFGIVDLCGFPKDRFYLYQSRWRPELPMAHLLPHWNWPERIGKVTPVHVYTSGDEAELFLNGQSLGRKKKAEYEYRLRWDDVVYQPGELKVVAYKNGQEWASAQTQTTGAPDRLELLPDRDSITADGSDLSFVTIRVVDREGRLVPRSHPSVRYTLDGPGKIIAVGNGDPTSHESFQSHERKVFNGLAMVVVRSIPGETGLIRLRAEANGLKPAAVRITSK